jgi:hypothetical protein
LASVLSVISPGSTKQLVVAEIFCVASLIIYVALGPYDDSELTMTSSICQFQVCYILFISILIKENVAISSTFIESSVVFAIVFVLVYELFWCIAEFCPLPSRVDLLLERLTLSKSLRSATAAQLSFRDAIANSIQVLRVRDAGDAAHTSHPEEEQHGDCHSIKVGKLKHQLEGFKKALKHMRRDRIQFGKLGRVLEVRKQSVAEEFGRVQALIARAKGEVSGCYGGEGEGEDEEADEQSEVYDEQSDVYDEQSDEDSDEDSDGSIDDRIVSGDDVAGQYFEVLLADCCDGE